MPKIVLYGYDKRRKQKYKRIYDTDASTFICQVPGGRLMKKPRKFNFYIYNPLGKTKQEKVREIDYAEARELVRTYGTKEQYCEHFSVLNPDGTYKNKRFYLNIDEPHRLRLARNASALAMGLSECMMYLIDKYDDMGIYNRTYSSVVKNKRRQPRDISEFTS